MGNGKRLESRSIDAMPIERRLPEPGEKKGEREREGKERHPQVGLRFKKCLFKAFIRRRSKNLQEKNTKKGRERKRERESSGK